MNIAESSMPEKNFEHEHVQTNIRVMSNDSHHKRNLMTENLHRIIIIQIGVRSRHNEIEKVIFK